MYQNPKEFSSFQKGEYEKVLEERLKGFSESPGKSNGKSNEKLPSFSQSSSTTEKDRQSPNRNAPKPFNPENQPTEETTSSQEYENYTQAKLQEMKNIYSEAQQTVNTQNKQSKATMQNINASNKSKAFERYYNKMAYKTYVPYSDRKKAEAFKTPDKYAKKPTTTKESKISETIKKTYLENKDIPTEKKDYNQDKIEIQSTNEGIKVEERNDMLAPRRETFGGEIIQIEDFSVEKISSPKESQPKSPKDGTQKSSPKSQNNISVKPSPKSQQGAQEGQEFAKVSQFQENVNEVSPIIYLNILAASTSRRG